MTYQSTAKDIEAFLTAVSTVAVAFFALVTIVLAMVDHFTSRRKAYDVVWLAANWLDGQWVAMRDNATIMALDGTLAPDDFLPPDWAGLANAVSMLSHHSAQFAGAALRDANSARNQARMFIDAGRRHREELRWLQNEVARSEATKAAEAKFKKYADVVSTKIVEKLRSATDEMYDALRCGPSWARSSRLPSRRVLRRLDSGLARNLLAGEPPPVNGSPD